MKTITAKQQEQFEDKLMYVKRKHPRMYKDLRLHLNDLGTRIMLGIYRKGFNNVTPFMSCEAMWHVLDCMEFPIDEEIRKYNYKAYKHE